MSPVYIFDIDGTLSDCSHRLHFIEKTPKDWPRFFAAVGGDPPIDHMCDLATLIADSGARIVFVSGRSDECRQATVDWLARNVGFSAPLYMRKAGDHRDDAVIKIELLAELRNDGYSPIMIFDDRARVVAAWRLAGVPCAQVAAGDF